MCKDCWLAAGYRIEKLGILSVFMHVCRDLDPYSIAFCARSEFLVMFERMSKPSHGGLDEVEKPCILKA